MGFDESARAIHRTGERVSFAKCERSLDPKPDLGSSEDRLIERIQMSTKTTFKRVALVTVAAMGFGLLSVVPSSATVQQGDTLTLASATSDGTLNTAATNTLTQTFLGTGGDTMTVTASMVSYPTGSVAVPVLSQNVSLNANGNTLTSTAQVGTLMDTTTQGTYSSAKGVWTVSFTPTLVGTYTMKFTPQVTANLTQTVAAAVTWTITVAAAGTSSAATSKSILAAGTTSAGSADVVVNVAKTVASTPAATIYVTPLTASGSSITVPESLTVSISGPGTAGIGTGTGAASIGKSFSVNAGSAGQYVVSVWADGTSGASTITVSSGTVTLGTETVTFVGDAASVVATLVNPVIAAGSTGTAGAITAIAKDSSGTVVSGVTLYAVASGSAITNTSAVTDNVGKATFTLVGKTAGTDSVVIQSFAAGSTAGTTGFSAAAVSVRVGSNVASTATMTLDKATYLPGELATLTVVVKDANGFAVVDGAYTVFAAALASSRALSAIGTLPTGTSVTVGSTVGTVSYTVNVPATSGAFTISALPASGLLGAGSGVALSAAATVSASAAEIANADAIAAAADAAAEATDAANAATDAANAAAEAADAATAAAQDAADAVATLGTQVAELIDGLKAQIAAQKAAITALTNLVIKIQKKLKA